MICIFKIYINMYTYIYVVFIISINKIEVKQEYKKRQLECLGITVVTVVTVGISVLKVDYLK